MNFVRTCTGCWQQSARTQASHVVTRRGAGRIGDLRSLSASSRALKKQQSRAVEEDEGEFEEDFIDDADLAPVEDTVGTRTAGGGTRDARHAEALARVERVTGLARYRLASNPPSPSLVTALVTHSTAQNLGDTLESIAKWRSKSLPLLSDQAVAVLVRRLAKLDSPAVFDAATVLADRSRYGVEINDVRTLYPLFSRLSRPDAVVVVDDATRDTDSVLAKQTATLFDLLTLARQHSPSTTRDDSFAHVATLASALQTSRTPTSPRIEELVAHVQRLGEDYILQEAAARLSKRDRLVLRYRAMRVTDELRKKQHAEVEWFAHLTERLVALTK